MFLARIGAVVAALVAVVGAFHFSDSRPGSASGAEAQTCTPNGAYVDGVWLDGHKLCAADLNANNTRITTAARTAAITGGAINGAVIGNTMPQPGTFTGLTASGGVNFTGIAGSTQCLQVNSGGVVSGTGLACGSGSGAVGTTGSPANGNLTMFSGGATITIGNLSGDCTTSGTLAVTCLKTAGVLFGTFATANAAAPPAIGTVTPGAGTFTALGATGGVTDTQTVAATSTDGVVVRNATAAAAGAQQWSPRLRFTAQGWKTTATAASQAVDVIAELQSVQGAANPTGNFVVSAQVNGGGYGPLFTAPTGGGFNLNGGTYQVGGVQIACASLSNASASCATDATNAANIASGTLPAARLPNPSSSTLGGVRSQTSTSHQWLNSISTSGVPSTTQPAFSDVSGTATVAQGGTGQTSYTNGQLLIGDTSTGGLDKATLTAGAGLTITNGNGAITIAATGSGGTVTSVACGSGLSGGTITGSGTCSLNLGNAQAWTAAQSFNAGTFILNGLTSGSLTVKPAAIAGANTLTLPAGTTDFSATGGTSQVVKQTSSGGALTVARLACADLSDSTFCSTSATNGVTLANIAQIGANTILGNSGAGTSNIAAMAMPSCSGAGQALIWTTSTGFGCASAVGSVSSVSTNNGLAGGTITTTGTIGLASISANTMLGNWSGSGAVPTAQAMPSCSGANSALNYTSGTGLDCVTSFALLGANTFTATQAVHPAVNTYGLSITSGSVTSGTSGFGANFVGTVNDATAVDGIIAFANVTCTLCTATSYLADWQVGGSSVFRVSTTGVLSLNGTALACATLSNAAASCSTDTTVASNITSGTLAAARLPNPSASSLGGVQSLAAVSHQWINTISTSGVPSASQPACADLSNAGTGCAASTGTSGATVPFLNGTNTWSGAQSINSGDLALKGSASGTLTLNAAATAGSNTLTLPAGTTDFSATGGASQVVKQTSAGAALTVGQLSCSDISGSATSCSTDATNAANISSGNLAASRITTNLGSALDSAFGSAQGDILYRNASGWTVLAPGTSGNFLKTLGAGANPQWAAAAGGTVTSVACGTGLSGGTITGAGTCALNLSNANTWTAAQTFSAIGVGAMASGTNYASFGADPALGGSVVWNNAQVRMGMTLSAFGTSVGSADEFMLTPQTIQADAEVHASTNGSTSSSSAVLHFASAPVVSVGMSVGDVTNPASIANSQTVLSSTGTSITLSGNADATVQSGDLIVAYWPNFKGPLFVATVSNDPYADVGAGDRASNAITAYSEIGNGVVHGFAEGLVVVAQENGTGSGLMIGTESDLIVNNDEVNIGCGLATSQSCHDNYFAANFGTKRAGWILESAPGGVGWFNGINLQSITSGGNALLIPNSTIINSRNAGGGGFVNIAEVDNFNTLQVGFGAAGVAVDAILNPTVGIQGVTAGSAASAGVVGEVSNNTQAASVSLTTATPANVAAISVAAGQWLACGQVQFSPAGGTSMTTLQAGISVTSATLPNSNDVSAYSESASFTAGFGQSHPLGCKPFNFASTTTVYLVAQASFSGSTMQAGGALNFMRVR